MLCLFDEVHKQKEIFCTLKEMFKPKEKEQADRRRSLKGFLKENLRFIYVRIF